MEVTNPCPVCGYLTLDERGSFDICPVCFWEDDGIDDDPDKVLGGPNADLSLNEARHQFKIMGATQKRLLAFVRPPREIELAEGLPPAKEISERQETARKKYGDDRWR